jgi:hypothetical protein
MTTPQYRQADMKLFEATVPPGMQAEMDIVFGDGIRHGDTWAGMRLDPDEPNKMVAPWQYVIVHGDGATQYATCVRELVEMANGLHPIEEWQTAN